MVYTAKQDTKTYLISKGDFYDEFSEQRLVHGRKNVDDFNIHAAWHGFRLYDGPY